MVSGDDDPLPVVEAGSQGLVCIVHPLADVDHALTPGATMDTPHGPARPVDVFNLDRRPGEVYRHLR
jgi:hypothetical protein